MYLLARWKHWLAIIPTLALVGDSSPPPISPQPPLPAAYEFSLDPARWRIQFSPGMPARPDPIVGCAPDACGWAFAFPTGPDSKGAASVHYIVTGAPGRLTGSKLILEYAVVETVKPPTYQYVLGDPKNTCGGPPHFSLYLQRRGDDLTAAKEFHRWFARAGEIKAGRATATASLTGAGWIQVFGKKAEDFPSQFQAAVAELGGIGFVFGGGCFAGHGINLAPLKDTGATFIVHKFRTE